MCLSATVSNAEEFADWIQTVRGATVAIIEERRPVELNHFYMVSDRESDELTLLPTFVDGKPNPEAAKLDAKVAHAVSYRGPQRRSSSALQTPRRAEVVERLEREGMLPAITFIFSRAACDDAVRQCLMTGMRLTIARGAGRHPGHRRGPHRRRCPTTTSRCSGTGSGWRGWRRASPPTTRGWCPRSRRRWRRASRRGWSRPSSPPRPSPSASTCPPGRWSSRSCRSGPARSTSSSRPGEYTQLTGRAGRRGIDEVGLRGRAVVAVRPLRPGGGAGVDPHLRPHVVVPADLQHGRQPGAAVHAGGGPPPAQPVVRPVPGRPRRRPPGAAGGAQPAS